MASNQPPTHAMDFLTYDDNYSALSSKSCLACGSKSPDCFLHHLPPPLYNPLPTPPTFHNLLPSCQSPLSFPALTPTITQIPRCETLTEPQAPSHEQQPCPCFRDALLTSEQLHYTRQTLPTLSLDTILRTTARAVRVCETYLRCPTCGPSLNSILCLNALRQTSACYRYLATSKTLVGDEEAGVYRCRIGGFEADAVLGGGLWRRVLEPEVAKAGLAVGRLEAWFRDAGDEVMAGHYEALVGGVKSELEETARLVGGV